MLQTCALYGWEEAPLHPPLPQGSEPLQQMKISRTQPCEFMGMGWATPENLNFHHVSQRNPRHTLSTYHIDIESA